MQLREPEFAETENGGSGPVSEEREIHQNGALTRACEVPQKLEVAEASSCNNKRVQEARRARVEWLQSLQKESASQEEFDRARSHSVWTQLDSSLCPRDLPSPAALERIRQENRLHFQHLLDTELEGKGDPVPPPKDELDLYGFTWFYADFGDSLEVGLKIGGGAQANIHKAVYNGKVLEWCVLKVFRSEHLLGDLERSWTRYRNRDFTFGRDFRYHAYSNCCGIKHGTLLQDGRFAFVLIRCWGDLHKAIDLEIVKDKTHLDPLFPLSIAMNIMVSIAIGMVELHHLDIIHKDLKAANCLLRDDPQVDLPHDNSCIIADYESSEVVEGTRFWRALEVLLALKNTERITYSTQASKKRSMFTAMQWYVMRF